MIAFVGVAATLWGVLHLYVGWRLIAPLELSPRGRAIAIAITVALWALGPITMVAGRALGVKGIGAVVNSIGYLVMGGFLVLFPLVLLRDLAVMLSWGVDVILARAGHPLPLDPERRRLLLLATNGIAAAAATAITGLGYVVARRRAEIVEVEVPIDELPEALHGYRIAQLSDIHVSAGIDRDDLAVMVGIANSLDADLIAVTGDLVDGTVEELHDEVAPLGDLRAPDGVFFVTGNHEYYWDAEAWIARVRSLGLNVLVNEHHVVARGDDARLVVAGVTDPSAHQMLPSHRSDPARAVEGAPDGIRILLAHQPKTIHEAKRVGYHLQLSGHTHGGQFFPWNLFVGLVHPIARGLGRFDRTWVYVNRGTGFWGPPNRAGVPAEITLVKLVRA